MKNNVEAYLIMLFGSSFNKQSTLGKLISSRIDGFSKKVIYSNIAKVAAFDEKLINDETNVIFLL